tara:strand:+ start:776 stop:1213 length:438 start_codon:yes stop_codon:yes gene_type:complete
MVEIKFVKSHKDAILPVRNHKHPQTGDAGFDLFAIKDAWVQPGEYIVVDVGLNLGYLTPGYWIGIGGRSGLGFIKSVQPHFGIIDNSYRGSLDVKLYNLSTVPVKIEAGKGVAQLIVYKMIEAETSFIDEVVKGERGRKSFGSSD